MTIYATSTICQKWKLPFYIPLVDEDQTSRNERSYMHYVSQHSDLVSAKCNATKWLLDAIQPINSKRHVREYFGGVGIMTTIIRGMFEIESHYIAERDKQCVIQLKQAFPESICEEEDAKKSLLVSHTFSDIEILDFPSSSIIHTKRSGEKWTLGFTQTFSQKPNAVIWTDTSVTYPIAIHAKKYEKELGGPITSHSEYIIKYSEWLYSTYGYSICRAAYRARNAVYFLAQAGKNILEEKHFPIVGNETGFLMDNAYSVRSVLDFA